MKLLSIFDQTGKNHRKFTTKNSHHNFRLPLILSHKHLVNNDLNTNQFFIGTRLATLDEHEQALISRDID
tara:strand:- start:423 stop:632 length:210 start_codon:yes stop_codon:yes gene_type:complete